MTGRDRNRCASSGEGKDSRSVWRDGQNVFESDLESELSDQIRQSAEFVEIPESLSPENILEKCRNLRQKNGNRRIAFGLSAAAIFLICCISLKGLNGQREQTFGQDAAAEAAPMEAAVETAEDTAAAGAAVEETFEERKNAGELYTLAGSYDAVYQRLEEIKTAWDTADNGGEGSVDGATFTTGVREEALSTQKKEFAAAEAMDGVRDLAADKQMGNVSYSKTNVQTFGVDESDIVKTDGKYLYLLRGGIVSIVEAGEEMKQVGEVRPEAGSESEVCAMYVDGDKLILMAQEYSTNLAKNKTEDTEEMQEKFAMADMLYMDTGVSVAVYTYDLSDRTKPVLLGKVTQDGGYQTSRKDGNIVYLFTEKYLMDDYENNPADAIPEVGARKIAEDSIYIGEQGDRALIISSISVFAPETVRDSVMLLDAGAEVYMGEASLYLYRSNYKKGEITEIAKFSLRRGFFNGEAAASVRGIVRDTFAIHEKDNKLRVLTTTSEGEWENRLVLLDENLKVTGTLERIAVGESIYAARYLGDMAYFITYRNTDPLFAADLSDEKHPKLVGELKITGFSEYLHFWGEDKLLGLGFETDPKTGEQKGLKLVMFDMSNPAELKVLGSRVLEEASYSPALYEYRAILVDAGENLIGFPAESYKGGVKNDYVLYKWENGSFVKILSETLTDDGYGDENYRGLYIGEKFYIAHPEVVRCYGRADYQLKQKLELK